MSRKRNPRRRTVSRIDRSSSVRQSKQLTFEQLEARHLLATFVVNSTADTVDSADGVVTLREAITSSNDTAGADTITFDSSVFSGAQTIDITSELPTITDGVTIAGPGADLLTVDAGLGPDGSFDAIDGFRILNIDDGNDDNLIDVEISGLTLAGGETDDTGGAINNNENLLVTDSTISGNSAFGGGGIANYGTLTIDRSTLSGNMAQYGGGVYNIGTATVTNSTLSANETNASGAGFNNLGTATISNTTISGNSATFGGGIENGTSNGLLTVINSTITGNISRGTAFNEPRGGGIDITVAGETTILTNTIVANSTGGDLGAGSAEESVAYGSFNLIGDGENASYLTDTITGDPLLGSLADNGGPTLTHALLPGSPAIDAGDNSVAETVDQRGLARNVNGVDIGAFEVQGDGQGDILSVTSFARDEGGAIETLARPDLLNQVAVEFSADVSISADDLVIRNDTLGGTLVDTSGLTFSYDASTQTATWDFSSLTLDAGFYSFELSSDIASVDGNSSLGGAFSEQVYVALAGDANLDGRVDVLNDAFILVNNLGVTGGTWTQGDFNGTGTVDVLGDAFILVNNLGQSVQVPEASAAMSQAFVQPPLAAIASTPSVSTSAAVVEQADDEDETVATAPRVAANATSPELSGDQVRDDAFESFGSLDSFWV